MQTVTTKSGSEYCCCTFAWFSYVEVSAPRPRSRCRVVLRYYLEHTKPGPIYIPPTMNRAPDKLDMILRCWSQQETESNSQVMTIMLKGWYVSSGFSRLYGTDLRIMGQLEKPCEKNDFCICLADLNKEILYRDKSRPKSKGIPALECQWRLGLVDSASYYEEDEEQEAEDLAMTLSNFVSIDGKGHFHSAYIEIGDDDFLFDVHFDEDNPSREKESSEEDATIKTWWKTVVIIMPRKSRHEFFMRGMSSDSPLQQFNDPNSKLPVGSFSRTISDVFASHSWMISHEIPKMSGAIPST
ncbi:hypothetical protein BDZ45DRAFT_67883 [Acephala macrosclerotiorum]|nr:hypothetical protein BDZ45DRAFT_67883 [Acephala macrosclerotiorum]